MDKVRYVPPAADSQGCVFINRNQYFEGVTRETWEFSIGGLPAGREVAERPQEPHPFRTMTSPTTVASAPPSPRPPESWGESTDAINARGDGRWLDQGGFASKPVEAYQRSRH